MTYTPEEVRRSLLTLAKHGGNSITAQAELQAHGLELAPSTLRTWKLNTHRDLYRELHETHAREIEGQLVSEFRDLASAAASAATLAVEKTVTALNAGDIKDPAGTARNLSTTAAISMDKLYLATDRPTQITERRDANEILRALEGRYGPNTVNGSAIEEKDPGPLLSAGDSISAQEQR